MTSYERGYDVARVGILAAIATALFTGLFFYVTDRGFGQERGDIYVRIATASGLERGNHVFYRGVKVGKVGKLSFAPGTDVVVQVKLAEKVALTTEAYAELVPLDLFGRQSLALRDGTTQYAPALQSGDTISGLAPTTITGKMSELGEKAERVVGDTMITLLRETLAGTATATRELAKLGASLERVVSRQEASLTAITSEAASLAHNLNVATAPEELVQTRANLQRMTARLDSTTASLSVVVAGIENGEGSAGKLLQDESLYVRTETLLASLEELVRDIKANPKRYINVSVF